MNNISFEGTRVQQSLQAHDERVNGWIRNGYHICPNGLWDEGDLTPTDRVCYGLLLRRLFNKDFSFPGQSKLAEELGRDVRTVKRCIKNLVREGWLSVNRRGQGRTNVYVLHKVF